MQMQAPKKETSNEMYEKKIIPQGKWYGRIYSIIDLGTQYGEFNGKETIQQKINITWECPEHTNTFDGVEKPLVIGKDYTFSMYKNEKTGKTSNLRILCHTLLNKDPGEDYDVSNLLGLSCELQTIIKTSKKGNDYADILNVSMLKKPEDCPAQFNPNFEYWICKDGDNVEKFNKLPMFIREKISKSKEMKDQSFTDKFEILVKEVEERL